MIFVLFTTTTNSIHINGAVVQTPSELDAFVEPQSEGGVTIQSPPADTVMEISAYSEYDSCHHRTEDG